MWITFITFPTIDKFTWLKTSRFLNHIFIPDSIFILYCLLAQKAVKKIDVTLQPSLVHSHMKPHSQFSGEWLHVYSWFQNVRWRYLWNSSINILGWMLTRLWVGEILCGVSNIVTVSVRQHHNNADIESSDANLWTIKWSNHQNKRAWKFVWETMEWCFVCLY